MKNLFSLIVFVCSAFLFLTIRNNVGAFTIIPDTQCSGNFTCNKYTNPCNWSNGGTSCTLAQRGSTAPILGTCTCTVTPTTESCFSSGTDCRIEDTYCDAGDNASSQCTFSGTGPVCGQNGCEAGESYANCPQDCGSCAPGYNYCGGCINACRSNSQSCATHINNECGTGGPAFCQTITSQEPLGCGGGCGACGRSYWKRDTSAACTPAIQAGNPLCSCGNICVSDPNCGTGCSPRCGQTNTCGGACSNADNGQPGAITFVGPPSWTVMPDGSAVPITGASVTLYWLRESPVKAEYYNVDIYPQGSDCSNPYAQCGQTVIYENPIVGSGCNSGGCAFVFTPDPAGGGLYTLLVQPVNTTCGTDLGSGYSLNFYLSTQISGTLFLDSNTDAVASPSICSSGTAIPTNLGTGGSIGAQGESASYGGSFSGSDYTISVPWGFSNNIVSLNPGDSGGGTPYIGTCPASTQYSGINSDQTDVDFFVIDIDLSNTGWWQAAGANVSGEATGGTALLTQVPVDTCDQESTCTSDMIARDTSDAEETAGIAITGGGSIDTTDDTGSQTGYVTDRTTQAFAIGTKPNIRETYDFFFRQYSMGTNPTSQFNASAGDATKPDPVSNPPTNGRAYYYDGSSGDFTIQQAWTVTSGEEIVIFINGDLRLTDPGGIQQLIDIEPGGFLGFIVAGDIIVEESVGNDLLDNTAANIEGFFVADGALIVESRGAGAGGDDRFVGEGTFVGWSTISLTRDFDDGGARKAENNTRPVELFRYRPDLVENTPERMTTPRYIWQETN